ncbi:MAG: 4-hydroxybenzoate octaprenyltransferase, partial [Xanthomonadales bacterium]|nr:4-hydroxybenzoate octaprenyltransferase [Xanthomonadales bacterium]
IMNDIADRDFDPHVARTRLRPIAAGEVSVRGALTAFLVLMAVALLLVLQTNALTVKLAFLGAALAASYPFFKRFTHWPQVVLGIAFGWGMVMAFAAETGGVPWLAWALLAVNTVWSVIYDTLYALVDIEDDRKIGVRSTAIRFGRHAIAVVGALEIVMLAALVVIGFWQGFTWPWFGGVLVAAGLMARQARWVENADPEGCFRAFLDHNWVGLAIFVGLLGHYAWSGTLGVTF